MAARLIAKGSVKISGYRLYVMEPPVVSASSTSNPPGNRIYVENVPSGWMKMLENYLENPENGGGEITDMELKDKRAHVTFSDPRGL